MRMSRTMKRFLQISLFLGLARSLEVSAFQLQTTIPRSVAVEAPYNPPWSSSSSPRRRFQRDFPSVLHLRRRRRSSSSRPSSLRRSESISDETTTTTTVIDDDDFRRDGLELHSRRWMFRGKYPIAYEVATDASTIAAFGREGDDASSDVDVVVDVVPIVLLNGFGVGSFHQHRLMRRLLLERRAKNNNHNEDNNNHNHNDSNDNNNHNNNKNVRYVVYGIDYLGQGRSWPSHCDDGRSPDEYQLSYSADTWIDQLAHFLRSVVLSDSTSPSTSTVPPPPPPRRAHLVGNSLGGYLAAVLSSLHPHLVSTVALLNATPVWGLNLPFWDGELPAPTVPRLVGRVLFDAIRDERTIDTYLETAYATKGAYDGTFGDGGLGTRIRECTEGNGGHAAFASILWSAPATVPDRCSTATGIVEGNTNANANTNTNTNTNTERRRVPVQFYQALQSLPMDVLLVFGSDDPWCTPAVAKRMHSTLSSRRGVRLCDREIRNHHDIDHDNAVNGNAVNDSVEIAPASRYIAIDNAGHCPNHEAPTAVAKVLSAWIDADCDRERDRDPEKAISKRTDVELLPKGESEERNDGRRVKVMEPWAEVWVREVSIEESRSMDFMDWMVVNMVG
ncbi:hypothetical protein ACHAXS_008880 [Conticribra weissflogii]